MKRKKTGVTAKLFASFTLIVVLAAALTVCALADDSVEVDNADDLRSAMTGAPADATRTIKITEGFTVSDSNIYSVPSNAAVIITSDDPVTITCAKSGSNFIRLQNAGSSLTLTGQVTIENDPSKYNRAIQMSASNTTFTLAGNAVISGFVYRASGGNGGAINAGAQGSAPGATVNIEGGTISNCRVTYNNPSKGGAIWLGRNAVLNMSGGTITGCQAPYGDGGAVYANGTDVTVNMSGGTISDCTAKNGGGIILLADSSATFTGGTISGCQATETYGGGIYAQGDITAAIENLTLDGNTARSSGGGIYLSTPSAVTLGSGTVITNNRATYSFGGGICLNRADGGLTIDGAEITDNYTGASGGGIYVSSGSEAKYAFTFSSGVISGNEAALYGGGISLEGGYVPTEFTGGTITGNTAQYGGGIYAYCAFTGMMENTEVTYNTATGQRLGAAGAGIYFQGGPEGVPYIIGTSSVIGHNVTSGVGKGAGIGVYDAVVEIKGQIEYNEANADSSGYGGGAYLRSGTVVLDGAVFTGNTASEDGGGIYVESTGSDAAVLILKEGTGGTFDRNEAGGKGGAICVARGGTTAPEIELYKMTLTDNVAADGGDGVYLGYSGTYGGVSAKVKGMLSGNILLAADAATCLEKAGDITSLEISAEDGTAPDKRLLISGDGTVTSADADTVRVRSTSTGTSFRPVFDGESGALLPPVVYRYTVKDAETGNTKTLVYETDNGAETLISLAALTASGDFAADASRTCFVGFAKVENYGEADASLTALYKAGGSATAADLDGETLYAVWIDMTTLAGASIRLPYPSDPAVLSGIRFVTMIDTVTMEKVGLTSIISESDYETPSAAGVCIGLKLTKEGGSSKTFCLDGRTLSGTWYGDDIWTAGGGEDLAGRHAFSFGLELTDAQYGFEFIPAPVIKVVYTDGTTSESEGEVPEDTTREGNIGNPLKRSAEYVAQKYAAWLMSAANSENAEKTYLGLTAAQMARLEVLSGLTYNSGTKTFS